jgi:glycosyltransferase involved in cell wall biosynthesis
MLGSRHDQCDMTTTLCDRGAVSLREGAVPTVIDGRFLLEPRPTGTHRSALGFARALLAQPNRVQLRICTDVTKVPPAARRQLEGVDWVHTPLRNKIETHLWEQLRLPRAEPGAVQLYPLNTGPFLLPGERQIIFMHDIHVVTSPHVFSRSFRLWNRFATTLAAQRAHNIICFTDYVKTDLVKTLQIDPDRISVVPQGPGIDLSAPAQESADIPERFFLCVGGLQPHKNLQMALLAFANSGLPESGYKLVIIGRRQQNFGSLDIAANVLEAPWLQFTGYVSDGELIAYYNRATALVYVSLQEGFGLPLVESFHLGCPVITSDASCLPEVAGTAALLVDPRDATAIAGAMTKLASDPVLRAELIARGRDRASLYTWERAGNAVAAEIQWVARNR